MGKLRTKYYFSFIIVVALYFSLIIFAPFLMLGKPSVQALSRYVQMYFLIIMYVNRVCCCLHVKYIVCKQLCPEVHSFVEFVVVCL